MIGMLWIAYKRLRGQPWLALLSVIGIALAIGLAVSVPVFAQAVSRAIMEDELRDLRIQRGRPPLALRLYLLPSSRSPIAAQQCLDLSATFASTYASNLGIPVSLHQTTVESGGLMLKTSQESAYGPAGTFLGNTKFGFLPGIEGHMRTVSGDPVGGTSGEALNVWVHESWAMEYGIMPGEQFVVQPILSQQPIKVRIAGTWLPQDADDPFWPAPPDGAWRSVLVVQPQEYIARVEPLLGASSVGSVSWVINLNEARFVPELAVQYVRGLQRAEVEVQQILPGVRCDVSPQTTLEAFLGRRRPLTLLLFSFSVPIIGFLLYFLTLVSGIVVDGQRQATAAMVSRGMGGRQVTEASFYEGLILLLFGTPLGILTGLGVARAMGHSMSFMRFVARSPLHVSLAGTNPWLILATVAVALVARLWPVVRRGRWTIVEHMRETVRPEGPSLWHWLYVDLVLIVPTLYIYRQLKQQGTIALLGWRSSGDIFRDPALFLVPVLFMLAAAMLCSQLFPLVMRLLDRLASSRLGLVSCLTIRQLGRQGKQYVSSLLLIMASLSVGVFMASMAASLDQWLADRMRYSLGADVVFQVENSPTPTTGSTGGPPSAVAGAANAGEWLIPWDKLLAIPGIVGATSAGTYRAELPITPDNILTGRFLAVDRATFASAAAFRPDFADRSLGELMNRLALRPEGILVSRQLLAESTCQVGDPLKIRVSPDGTNELEFQARIVGVYDYFPTVYDDEAPTVVGSLDHLLTTAGGVSAYDIWLRADPRQVDPARLPSELTAAVNYYSRYRNVWALIREEQEKKERIGVYGTLSTGFLASLVLSGIGLLIQYQKSLRERLFRFATLRAIGISRRQLVAQVQLEYLIVLAAGVLAGIAIGVQASRLFIPYFRVSTPDGRLPLPPLLLLVDRHSILVMAVAFALVQILAQGGLIRRAVRSELFQVLRMGSQE